MGARIPRLVVIEAKSMTYTAYEGRKRIDKIKSSIHLDSEFVEYFRKHTEEVMSDIDGGSDDQA